MTTDVLIVSTEAPDGPPRFECASRPGAVSHPVCRVRRAVVSTGSDLEISRTAPGPGWIVNLGARYLRLAYRLEGAPVGPTTDLLAPGTVRELGMGPGVTWRLAEVS